MLWLSEGIHLTTNIIFHQFFDNCEQENTLCRLQNLQNYFVIHYTSTKLLSWCSKIRFSHFDCHFPQKAGKIWGIFQLFSARYQCIFLLWSKAVKDALMFFFGEITCSIWLQCRSEAVDLSSASIAAEDENSHPRRGHCRDWFRNGRVDSDDDSGQIRGLYDSDHCTSFEHDYGQYSVRNNDFSVLFRLHGSVRFSVDRSLEWFVDRLIDWLIDWVFVCFVDLILRRTDRVSRADLYFSLGLWFSMKAPWWNSRHRVNCCGIRRAYSTD